MQASLILENGRIATMRDREETVSAVALGGGRVLAVGEAEDMRSLRGPGTRVIDLQGRFACPGLIDAHAHVELGSYARDFWLDIRGASRAEALSSIAAAVAGHEDEWLVVQATYRQDLPSREELDGIAPRTPIVVRLSMHRLVANSTALRLSGIDRLTGDPAGSRIERGPDGAPTGVIEEGFDLMAIPVADSGRLRDALRRSLETQFLHNGVTTVYELPASTGGTRAYQDLHRAGELPVRLTLNPIVRPGHQPTASFDGFLETGFQTGFGDEWLSLGALKLFVDGDDAAAFGRGALPGSPAEWGVLTRTYEQLAAQVLAAFAAGVQLWIHAIGDAAQEMTLDAIAAARRVFPDLDARPRIEHIANSHWDPAFLERLVADRIVPVPTAAFMHGAPGDEPGSATPRYLYRTLMEAGLRPPGNSDTAGTQPFATNPLHGWTCLVGRTNVRGEPIWPDERISFREALEVYTVNSAWAGFLERSRGRLEPGMLGDVAVFSTDVESSAPADYQDAQVDLTIIGGEVRYER